MGKFKYKQFSLGIAIGVILATGTSVVFAEDGLQKIEAYLRPNLPITLNGQSVKLDNPPVMVDGSTYLRLRDVSKLTGVQVVWNEVTQTVQLSAYENNTIPATHTPNTPAVAQTTPTNDNNTSTNVNNTPTPPPIDLSQFLPILRKDHDVSFDRSTLTISWNMTDEEYLAYKSIVDRFTKHGFCMRIYQYSAGKLEINGLKTVEEEQLKMSLFYNSKVIATVTDNPISNPKSLIEY